MQVYSISEVFILICMHTHMQIMQVVNWIIRELVALFRSLLDVLYLGLQGSKGQLHGPRLKQNTLLLKVVAHKFSESSINCMITNLTQIGSSFIVTTLVPSTLVRTQFIILEPSIQKLDTISLEIMQKTRMQNQGSLAQNNSQLTSSPSHQLKIGFHTFIGNQACVRQNHNILE